MRAHFSPIEVTLSTTHQSHQFQDDNITVKLERRPGCLVHMDVTISPLATQAAYEKAIKNVSKEVSVPGFRKGKAPRDMIVKNFSKYVESEWKELTLKTAFQDAIKLSKAYPFKEEIQKAHLGTISLEDGATMSYDFEAHPEIPSINPEELSIKMVERKPVTDKDIDTALENLRLQHAEWHDITDRSAAEGDYVDIDIDAVEEPVRNICKSSRFQIASGKMGEWMRNLLIGMSPGESAEKMSEKEEDESECQQCIEGEEADHEHHHFKPTLCRITLHAIKKATLPALDDDFSKKFNIESIEKLKERVVEDLNKQADEEHSNSLRARMEQAIMQKYAFDVPASLVKEQVKERRAEIIQELTQQGVNESILDAEAKKVALQVASRLTRDFCLFFLAQKVMQENHIEVKEDELMQELMRQMWLNQSGQSIIHPSMDASEVRSRLIASLTVNKAIDFLIDKCKK